MRRVKPIHILFILLIFIASIIWTYSSLKSPVLVVSYAVDAALLLLIIYLLVGRTGKEKVKINHDNYKDYITEGSVDKNNRLNINIFSLEDLVKLAIDAGKRVIHDPKLGHYYVFMEEVAYVHDPAYVDQVLDNKQQVGKILLDKGIIRTEQLDTGLYYQKKIGIRLGDSLTALGFIDDTVLYSTIASQYKLPYYELDADMEIADTSWLGIMNVNMARALQALPLGKRTDGRLVIACGETAMAGIEKALKEMFGEEIYIVAAKPSRIYELLEHIEVKERNLKNAGSFQELLNARKLEPYERLSADEGEQFVSTYLKGRLDIPLFMKASGLVSPNILTSVPDPEGMLGYLNSKNYINGEMTNLVLALSRIVKRQDLRLKQDKVMPSILDLLKEAYYINSDTTEWVLTENLIKKKPIAELLEENFLVSKQTIGNAELVLDIFKKLANKSVIF
ncbi:MAG TPA: hypothetical protein GXX75_20360 [Clostridiales bacterium]|nr:hypothetical protein [Clostridiales bacterium]